MQLGFNQERLLLFSVNARQAGYQGEAIVRFYETLQTDSPRVPVCAARPCRASPWFRDRQHDDRAGFRAVPSRSMCPS